MNVYQFLNSCFVTLFLLLNSNITIANDQSSGGGNTNNSTTNNGTAASNTASHDRNSLNALYDNMKRERTQQLNINKEREQAFLNEKNQKAQELTKLKLELKNRKLELARIKKTVIETNEEILKSQKLLDERSHALKDLFSVWKQGVRDSENLIQGSLVNHQHLDSLAQLRQLKELKRLPMTEELSMLFDIQKSDIHHNAQISEYQGKVTQGNGESEQQSIHRIASFNSYSPGSFLRYNPEKGTLTANPRQPESRFIDTTLPEKVSDHGSHQLITIDPSRGQVLDQLEMIPTWQERFHQGGYIGYAIVSLGIAGLLLSLVRWMSISMTQRAISRQAKQPENIDENNPLGKILVAYQKAFKVSRTSSEEKTANTDTLEIKLQEIITSEIPKLDRGLGTLKLLAAIAPLLGLLGTVVGMINTFQSITLVGNADPKLMAGGISQALMTTVLGLLVAVPMLFSHNYISARTRTIMMFLSQQSLGFIAQALEYKQDSKRLSSNAVTSNLASSKDVSSKDASSKDVNGKVKSSDD